MELKLNDPPWAGSSNGSAESSAASTSRPSSRLSVGRPSVQFASPRTLVVSFPDSARYDSSDSSASASALSSARVPPSSSSSFSSLPASSAHFEHELALQRREFEQRFADFQQRTAGEQSAAECAAYRAQGAAMREQLRVQELFMACQRVELAHFHQQRQREEQQRQWEARQAEEHARLEGERREADDSAQRTRMDSVASQSSADPFASDSSQPASTSATTDASHPSRPATSASALSSISSVLDAAVSASARSSLAHSTTASPFAARPTSSSSSLSASRLSSAALLSPRRAATAASSVPSAFASPFLSSAARSASLLSLASSSSYPHSVFLSASGSYPFLASASAASLPSQSSPEPSLADVLALTESLLSQTDESLQAERRRCAELDSSIVALERQAAATSRQYDADSAEVREQLRIRAAVCAKQEEALHRLTFENHSLVQQIVHMQLAQQQQQQPAHPTRTVQPSSHHLPAAAAVPQSVTPRAAVRDKSGGMFPPIPSASVAASSASVGRLSKSRFVQPPPAVALAAGFQSDSSHASPISSAALGWSQGWKSYHSEQLQHGGADGSGHSATEQKEQLSQGWSMRQLDTEHSGVVRAPLLLFPTLQPSAPAYSDSSESEQRLQLSYEAGDNVEVVVASSPLAQSSQPQQLHSTATLVDGTKPPLHSLLEPAASSPEATTAQPAQLHVSSATLQLPTVQSSPEQLHLHAHFHRPAQPPHDTQPPRVPPVLRQQSSRQSPAARRVHSAVGELAVQATAVAGRALPPTGQSDTVGPDTTRTQPVDSTDGGWDDELAEQSAGTPADADGSEHGWVARGGATTATALSAG